MWVVVECDSDGDIRNITGPFPDLQAGLTWLKEVCVPAWVKSYEAESGFKANVGFFGNGASDGTTCTYWVVKSMNHP